MGLSVVNQRRDGRQQRPHHHREASPMGGSQVGWEPDTTHTPRQAQGQTGTLSYVWWWCVGFVSGWCNRKREDQGSSCCIQIARFVLGCWRVRGPEKSHCFWPRFVCFVCFIVRRKSFSGTNTRLRISLLHIQRTGGWQRACGGQDKRPPSSSRLLPPRHEGKANTRTPWPPNDDFRCCSWW